MTVPFLFVPSGGSPSDNVFGVQKRSLSATVTQGVGTVFRSLKIMENLIAQLPCEVGFEIESSPIRRP